MNDVQAITEVAQALHAEVTRQDDAGTLREALKTTSGTIDCEKLAQVAIESYLTIQRRLVAGAMERHQQKTQGQHHAEDSNE